MTTRNFLASMTYCIYGWPKRCDCLALIAGKLNSDFSVVEVGPIIHSRWHTFACRILRCYVSERKISTALVTLNKFCVQVYFPSWFQIKSKHKLTDGLKNLFDLYKKIQNFSYLKVKNISLKVIERNGYFAHPENILLGMMADPDQSIRNAAVEKIVMHIRNHGAKATELIEEGSKNMAIRRFEVTQITCKAQLYHNMANIDAEKIAEPSLQARAYAGGGVQTPHWSVN